MPTPTDKIRQEFGEEASPSKDPDLIGGMVMQREREYARRPSSVGAAAAAMAGSPPPRSSPPTLVDGEAAPAQDGTLAVPGNADFDFGSAREQSDMRFTAGLSGSGAVIATPEAIVRARAEAGGGDSEGKVDKSHTLPIDPDAGVDLVATSFDARHPINDILTEDMGTFWSTTGGFPQEIEVRFPSTCSVTSITVWATGVERMSLLVPSAGTSSAAFEVVDSVELPDLTPMQQKNVFRVPRGASDEVRSFRLRIDTAFWEVVCVHHIRVFGAQTK